MKGVFCVIFALVVTSDPNFSYAYMQTHRKFYGSMGWIICNIIYITLDLGLK